MSKKVPKGGITESQFWAEIERRQTAGEDVNFFSALGRVKALNSQLADLERKEEAASRIVEDSPLYEYAQRILQLGEKARVHVENGDAGRFHSAIVEVCQLALIANTTMLGPHADRGYKLVESAKKGQVHTHGTSGEKRQRWQDQRDAYKAARSEGESKKSAKSIAAEHCGVSVRAIERAFKYVGESIP